MPINILEYEIGQELYSNLDSSLWAAVSLLSNYTPKFSKLADNKCQLSY